MDAVSLIALAQLVHTVVLHFWAYILQWLAWIKCTFHYDNIANFFHGATVTWTLDAYHRASSWTTLWVTGWILFTTVCLLSVGPVL